VPTYDSELVHSNQATRPDSLNDLLDENNAELSPTPCRYVRSNNGATVDPAGS